ncbi:MAG TPA: DinB family protein, partial [Gemmatimonadaceae bacterium]|nr:DinB family protein [Gemmatimonadaceae bacterium]
VPFDNADWKPHPKSTSLGALASHVAGLAGFAKAVVSETFIDMAPAGQPRRTVTQYHSTEELLAAFDESVKSARDAIVGLADADLMTPWSLKGGEAVFFTLPRGAVLRTMMMNHIIHHRGQLTVYLRLNDVPLPPIYGPTADS